MNDLISRQAAYDTLTEYYHHTTETQHTALAEALSKVPEAWQEEFEWCTGCKEYDQEQHCCHRFTKTIRDTVEEIKAWGEWILWEDKRPENYEDILISMRWWEEDGTTHDVTTMGYIDEEGTVVVIDNAISYGAMKEELPKAWMPLPEPYKGDNDERVDSMQ